MILVLLGLIFGSFITALSWRYPRDISNIKGRSFCDNCGYELKWYDNIPFFSYVFLKGRCRSCKKKISIRYPLIELISAIGFFLIGYNVIYLILFVILFTIFVIDFEHQIIPDGFIFAGFVLLPFIIYTTPLASLFSGFLASFILLLIHLITKGRGMGLGDVKFAILGGSIVGLNLLPVWFFVSFLTGGIVGSILILLRLAKLKDKIAFGPFLITAIPITLIWGEKIIKALL
jgi:leader peptidase (prepilin peptidase)/N-methyltransferase